MSLTNDLAKLLSRLYVVLEVRKNSITIQRHFMPITDARSHRGDRR